MTDGAGPRSLLYAELSPARPPSARGMWALGFVALSLVALVAVPSYFGQRVAAVQNRITTVVEPAARLSAKLDLLKARQMARVEGFILSSDPLFRDYYSSAIDDEDAVLDSLGLIAQELDRDVFDPVATDTTSATTDLNRTVFERVAALRTASFDWRFNNRLIFEEGPGEGSREVVRQGYEELQRATRDLELTILAQVDGSRRRMSNEQRLQSRITYALAFVALFATLIVARVAYRYRSLTVEQEKRRREAVQARREIDALLEATDDGVLGLDLDGRCTSLNRAGARLLGYTETEICGRDLHATIFHSNPDGSQAARETSPVLAAATQGDALESEEGAVLWRRRRIPFPARWSLLPMIDGTELRGAVLTFTDMTETLEREHALRRAVRHREDVVSIVSHDLRNPLGVALAAADLLLDLPLDEQKRRRQAEIIRRSGKADAESHRGPARRIPDRGRDFCRSAVAGGSDSDFARGRVPLRAPGVFTLDRSARRGRRAGLRSSRPRPDHPGRLEPSRQRRSTDAGWRACRRLGLRRRTVGTDLRARYGPRGPDQDCRSDLRSILAG